MEPPREIRLVRAEKRLAVTFADGTEAVLAAEYLRVESPSAEVQGHSPEQKVTVAGKREVGILGVEPVGHYAIRILFDDGHDSGIYSWEYLARLAAEREERWAGYLAALSARGLSRDPPHRH
ncbi:MAG: gamma-butyrobetaine hydroxylase-like domain-containing protein [Acetobacteraceae bacterium]